MIITSGKLHKVICQLTIYVYEGEILYHKKN